MTRPAKPLPRQPTPRRRQTPNPSPSSAAAAPPCFASTSSCSPSSAAAAPLPSSLQRHLSATASISTPRFSIEDYLTTICGLSRAQALKASAHLSHLRSPSKPDAVLSFLSGIGMSRSDIADLVAKDPKFLCSKVDGTLAPGVAALRASGLSDSDIARLVLVTPKALHTRDMPEKLGFWIPLFGSFDEFLQAVSFGASRAGSLLSHDIDKVVQPNIAELLRCGVSVRDLAKVGIGGMWVMFCSPEKIKALVARADELGVPRNSALFKHALVTVYCLTEEKLASRMELLRRILGCSEDQLRILVVKQPSILRMCEDNLRSTAEFLINEVGLEPEYIVRRPAFFTYSLKGRLMPRYVVMKTLQDKGLPLRAGYCSLLLGTEENFISRYIGRFKEIVPELADVYAAACAGKIPSQL